MVAGKCASRARRMVSAQAVRSDLFFPVRIGTGKLFQPIVPEYDKSVRIRTHTVEIQIQCRREEMIASSYKSGSITMHARLLITVFASRYCAVMNGRRSDTTFGTAIWCLAGWFIHANLCGRPIAVFARVPASSLNWRTDLILLRKAGIASASLSSSFSIQMHHL